MIGYFYSVDALLRQCILQAGHNRRSQLLQLGDFDDKFSPLVVCKVPSSSINAGL